MKCPYCRKENKDGDKICGYCKADIVAEKPKAKAEDKEDKKGEKA